MKITKKYHTEKEKPYRAWKEIETYITFCLDYFNSLYDGLDFTGNWDKNDFVTLLLAAPYLSDVSHINDPLQALTSAIQIVQEIPRIRLKTEVTRIYHVSMTHMKKKTDVKLKLMRKFAYLICGRCNNVNL